MRAEGPQVNNGKRQPIFTLPSVVLGLVGVIVAIHAVWTLVFDLQVQLQFTIWFAFIPIRIVAPNSFPGGFLPILWTPFTHALLHASWEHLLMNMAWLAIFGTPVARRYGPVAFLVMFFVCALVGAAAFAATTVPNLQVLVGASGGIAGLTGAAMRFVFQPVEVARHPDTGEIVVLGRRLAGLRELLVNVRTRTFILIWVVLNGMTPLFPLIFGGPDLPIAWQAHLGGFFTGLLMVPLFERRSRVQETE